MSTEKGQVKNIKRIPVDIRGVRAQNKNSGIGVIQIYYNRLTAGY